MPIRPENKARYPKTWKAISKRIRTQRAGNKCENCGAPNGQLICRGEDSDDGTYMLDDGRVFDAFNGDQLRIARGSEYIGRPVLIVLTVAHLDHNPENCADENLRAWCQRCHNKYDAPSRARGIKQRAREKMASGDLFEVQ